MGRDTIVTDADGTIQSWAWSFDDEASSSSQNPTHQYADNGTYSVGLTVTDNEIEKVAHDLCGMSWIDSETVIAHTSGAINSAALSDLGEKTSLLASCHPLQTVMGADDDWEKLRGIPFGLEGDD